MRECKVGECIGLVLKDDTLYQKIREALSSRTIVTINGLKSEPKSKPSRIPYSIRAGKSGLGFQAEVVYVPTNKVIWTVQGNNLNGVMKKASDVLSRAVIHWTVNTVEPLLA